jgi:hypothetical protein
MSVRPIQVLTSLSAALLLLSSVPALAAAQQQPDIRISDADANEGRDMVFTVEVTGPHPGLSVDYATVDGTALAGEHYVQTSGTLNISANRHNSVAEIRVPTQPDDVFEPDQAFFLRLSNTFGNLVRSRAEGRIHNNDNFPAVKVLGLAHLREPDQGELQNVPYFVTLTNPGSLDVTVHYRTVPGTARGGLLASPTDDFEAQEGILTFPAFTSFPREVLVHVNGDDVHEQNETFSFRLSDPINARLGDSEATTTIIDDDPEPTLSIGDITVPEGNSGPKAVSMKVSLSNPTDSIVTFTVSTANKTAVAPTDFVEITDGTSNTLLIGELEKTITVTVNGDQLLEPTESLLVILSNATNAILGDAVGELTLTNDDNPIIISEPPILDR